MKRNAFTLIELLAVIVILAIILIVGAPAFKNTIRKSKKNSFTVSVKKLLDIAERKTLDLGENEHTYTLIEGETTLIELGATKKSSIEGTIQVTSIGSKLTIHDEKWCAIKTFDMENIEVNEYSGTCSN